jgi:hypothetical protein
VDTPRPSPRTNRTRRVSSAEERAAEVEKELLQQLDEANEEAEEASDARLEAEEALKRAEDRVHPPSLLLPLPMSLLYTPSLPPGQCLNPEPPPPSY